MSPLDRDQLLTTARDVLRAEAAAVAGVVDHLDGAFVDAVHAVLACTGHVVVVGIGKSWLVGQKISATLASTGTPSHALHAAEALHGDLGRLRPGDVLLAMSNSGETEEVLRCIGPARGVAATVIALVGRRDSSLARHADMVLCVGEPPEADPLGLAPTASTTAALALGDALALAVARARELTEAEYARYHPGGALGRRLMRVADLMRTGDRCPRARPDERVADALLRMTRVRAGAIAVVSDQDQLVGLFTDGDLRRALAQGASALDRALADVMSTRPTTVRPDTRVTAAAGVLGARQFDELPVVDDAGRLVGMLDIQDVVAAGLAP
jgi:arabinose-5-phosphate isomerase